MFYPYVYPKETKIIKNKIKPITNFSISFYLHHFLLLLRGQLTT